MRRKLGPGSRERRNKFFTHMKFSINTPFTKNPILFFLRHSNELYVYLGGVKLGVAKTLPDPYLPQPSNEVVCHCQGQPANL